MNRVKIYSLEIPIKMNGHIVGKMKVGDFDVELAENSGTDEGTAYQLTELFSSLEATIEVEGDM